ncbi:NAD(P)/FAD-dependent oxidoreductase [Sporobolomyces koalae]|uniref:NAD(P)/FAD-dependent oxidoreductase n=1 Tax=Sporobolomyces koalae TaxID=500713 RepID=UPI00317D8E12
MTAPESCGSPCSSLLSHFPPSGSVPPCSPPNAAPLDSFWTKHFSGPLAHAGRDSPLPDHADIVVIGAGLTGTCAVDALVERLGSLPTARSRKVTIVVLEAREFCSGATARNGGHLTSAPILGFATLTQLYGQDEATRCVALEQYSIDWIINTCRAEGWEDQVELRAHGGNLHLFDDELQARRIDAELEAARTAGLDLTGFERLTPQQRYEATSRAGGLLIPGNNLFPRKLVSKLFERAQARAASRDSSISLNLYTHCAVSAVQPSEHDKSWSVVTPRGNIQATHVLHCTNGYLSSVLPEFAAGPSRVLPTRGQVVSIVHPTPTPPPRSRPRESSSWPRFTNAFSAEHPFDIYMFQRTLDTDRREIILGGCREESGPRTRYEFGQSFDGAGSVNKLVGNKLRQYLAWQFPNSFRSDQPRAVQVELEWTGIMGFREGGVPIVGPIYIKGEIQTGQWVAAGYSGHGMPRAPASGHLLGHLVANDLLGRGEFTLPVHFPRHYLTTSNGEPNVEARLPGEARGDEREGWVWVRREDVEP